MMSPRQERSWLTLRSAFGHRSAARAIALQVRTAKDQPTEFRLISNLSASGMWRCEATFPRSDLAFRAYLTCIAEARLTDYFEQPPMQTPPRWILPSPEGAFLSVPQSTPDSDSKLASRRSFWRRVLHSGRWGWPRSA